MGNTGKIMQGIRKHIPGGISYLWKFDGPMNNIGIALVICVWVK
jgi:hypothetical protein